MGDHIGAESREKGGEWIGNGECVKQMENKQRIKGKKTAEPALTSSGECFLLCRFLVHCLFFSSLVFLF